MKRIHIVALMIILANQVTSQAKEATTNHTASPQKVSSTSPPTPYEDQGACPFECCTYRTWISLKETLIRKERTNNSPLAFRLREGEKITAITGIVITTRAGQARVIKPFAVGGNRVRVGEIVYLLTYQGEGVYKIWYRAKTVVNLDVMENIQILSRPQSVWWIKIRNSKGQIGWTNQGNNFCGSDECGGDCEQPSTESQNRPARKANNANSIRRIDFRNFVYRLSNSAAELLGVHTVQTRNGQWNNGKPPSDIDWKSFRIQKVIYGDVTGDGYEEAVILALDEQVGANPANSVIREVYVYTILDGKISQLVSFDEFLIYRDYDPYVNPNDQCDGWFWNTQIKQLVGGVLSFVMDVGGRHCVDRGYTITMSYRWNGNRFFLIGKPVKKRAYRK